MNERYVSRYLNDVGVTKELITPLGIKSIIIKHDEKLEINLFIRFFKCEKIDMIKPNQIITYLNILKVQIRKEKISKLLASN